MYAYVIPPLAHLDLMHEGDAYFCLAHLYLKHKKYRNFFLHEVDRFEQRILCDNGAAEGSLVTESVLLHIVDELQPDEVIAPDVLLNKARTLAGLASFVERMKKKPSRGKTHIFGCPQGSTLDEWLECYYAMLRHPDVSTIGLSKYSVPYCWSGATGDQLIRESRHKCVRYLLKRDLLTKPTHCLGQGDPTEFLAYAHPNIRSTDSCYPILAAIHNVDFRKGFKRVPTTNDYFKTVLSKKQMKLALSNIAFLKECCYAN